MLKKKVEKVKNKYNLLKLLNYNNNKVSEMMQKQKTTLGYYWLMFFWKKIEKKLNLLKL